MNEITNFLKKRRSVTAKSMNAGHVSLDHLNEILDCGLRVPDHGALNPWKLNVIQGDARKRIGAQIFAKHRTIFIHGFPCIENRFLRSQFGRFRSENHVFDVHSCQNHYF